MLTIKRVYRALDDRYNMNNVLMYIFMSLATLVGFMCTLGLCAMIILLSAAV